MPAACISPDIAVSTVISYLSIAEVRTVDIAQAVGLIETSARAAIAIIIAEQLEVVVACGIIMIGCHVASALPIASCLETSASRASAYARAIRFKMLYA